MHFGVEAALQGGDAGVEAEPFGGKRVNGGQLGSAVNSGGPLVIFHFLAGLLRVISSYQIP